MNHGCSHGQLFLHAVRVIRHQRLRLCGEFHEIEQLGSTLRGGVSVQAIHASGEIQELGTRQAPE